MGALMSKEEAHRGKHTACKCTCDDSSSEEMTPRHARLKRLEVLENVWWFW